MKKYIKHFNIIIIILSIVLSTMLIGTPTKQNNVQIVYAISSVFAIIYFLSKIIKREKINLNILDICVCILAFSTLIPLIFKTYVSLSESVLMSVKYISILNLYLILKHECSKETKYINIILNTIIVSILILCFFGIDEITNNVFDEVKRKIGYIPVNYDEIRVCSLFSYPNAMAIVAASGFFLCVWGFFKYETLKRKIFYVLSGLIMLITLFLTYSRLVYLFFAFTCFIYALILCKKYNIKEKINKELRYIFSIVGISIIICIVVGLQVPRKVKIEENYQKILYEVQSDTDYIFEFNISNNSENIENFEISIIEKNKYFDDVNTTVIGLEEAGMQKIEIHTTDATNVIYLNIYSKGNDDLLIIDEAYMNNEKFILQYKFLPTGVVDKIKSISLKNKSAWERLIFIKDATKPIEENWLLGLGGNAWKKIQNQVQSYNYYANEVHCFPIQVFLEFGIFGFLSCIGIIIFILKRLFQEFKSKEINIEIIAMLIGILIVLLHSFLDFDMSNYYILLIVFLMISIINSDQDEKNNNKITIIISVILIILSVCNLYISTVEIYYRKQKDINKMTETKILNIYSNILCFDIDVKERKYNALQRRENKNYIEIQKTIIDFIKNEKYSNRNVSLMRPYAYIESTIESENLTEDKFEYILKYIEDTKDFYKYSPSYKFERFNNLVQIYDILKENNYLEYAEKVKEILRMEILENQESLLDYEKCRYNKEFVIRYKNKIEEIINRVNGE